VFQVIFSEHILKSDILKNQRKVWIQKSSSKAPPTLILFLDGELYLQMGANEIVAHYECSNRSVIACFVSSIDRQTRFKENACYYPFVQFISDELSPWLRNETESTFAPEKSIICGLSLTGLTSAFIGMVLQTHFRKIICQSGAFWWNNEWLIHNTKNYKLENLSFFICVGNKETQTNINHYPGFVQTISQLDSNRRMRNVLIREDVLIKYAEVNGNHSLDTWKETLPLAISYLI
jgi:enterochelin esterase family protein